MKENLSVQQLFVTQIAPKYPELPDFEILSLPGTYRPEDLRTGVRAFIDSQKRRLQGRLVMGKVDRRNIDEMLDDVVRAEIEASGVVRSRTRPTVESLEKRYGPDLIPAYAALISKTPFPVMRSPIAGATLKLLTSAADGIGLIASVPDAAGQPITLGFLLLGGSIIVTGAALGVSKALELGLKYHLLKLMRVPSVGKEKTTAKRSAAKTKPAKSVTAKKATSTGSASRNAPAKKATRAKTARQKPPVKAAAKKTPAAKKIPAAKTTPLTLPPPPPPVDSSASTMDRNRSS